MPGGPTAGEWFTYQFATRSMVRVIASATVVLGGVLIWGGPARFSSPGFATARQVPGQQDTWGVLFIASGALAWAGIYAGWRRKPIMVGLACQAVLFFFLAMSLAVSASRDSRTALTGAVVYGMASMLCVIAWSAGHALRHDDTGPGRPGARRPRGVAPPA